MQRHFRVTLPSVHQIVLNLDRVWLIDRISGKFLSIRVPFDPNTLPTLK